MEHSNKHTNALAGEKSPYLLQHAHNPVDWRPWGQEALAEAGKLDRPILVSIGYATCHWCHVMERESFENEDIAALMNAHFIPIKVDREERPDVDKVYMEACMALTGQGGWPLNVFLTPELKPFYGGTYFPPQPFHGRPSWSQVLSSVAKAWQTDRDKMEQSADQLTQHLLQSESQGADPESGPVPVAGLVKGLEKFFRDRFDKEFGGFGPAPKFPKSTECLFLLQRARLGGNQDLQDMALFTLDAMANGGLYDQIGGGFARYATDERWLVPHFEKMLYDNALLIKAYTAAWQTSGNPRYAQVVEQTIDWLKREMTHEQGGFYSAQDADSEGKEGLFYVWTPEQIRTVLGEQAAEVFTQAYGVNEAGNFEGKSILFRQTENLEKAASAQGCSLQELEDKLEVWGLKLRQHRDQRIWPITDDKVLTEWNGLMIGALAVAARVMNKPQWADMAAKAGHFVWSDLREQSGRLKRRWRLGEAGKLAVLEDYACLAEGFLDLFESTGQVCWLKRAKELAGSAQTLFQDSEKGGFFQTGSDAPVVLHRLKDTFDGATPSGNGVLAAVFLRLWGITSETTWEKCFMELRDALAGSLTRAPHGLVKLVSAMDLHHHGMAQVVLIPASTSGQENSSARDGKTLAGFWQTGLGEDLAKAFMPEASHCPLPKDSKLKDQLLEELALAKNPEMTDRQQIQICARQTCYPPVSTWQEVTALVQPQKNRNE